MRGRRMGWIGVLLLAVAGTAQALSHAQQRGLQQVQELYAAAIRWNDLDAAERVIDPLYRQQHPQTRLERARFEQVQVSGYSVLRSGEDEQGRSLREVEIRLINRNSLAERRVRVRELWRWDAGTEQWWLASGLPDLWQGE